MLVPSDFMARGATAEAPTAAQEEDGRWVGWAVVTTTRAEVVEREAGGGNFGEWCADGNWVRCWRLEEETVGREDRHHARLADAALVDLDAEASDLAPFGVGTDDVHAVSTAHDVNLVDDHCVSSTTAMLEVSLLCLTYSSNIKLIIRTYSSNLLTIPSCSSCTSIFLYVLSINIGEQ